MEDKKFVMLGALFDVKRLMEIFHKAINGKANVYAYFYWDNKDFYIKLTKRQLLMVFQSKPLPVSFQLTIDQIINNNVMSESSVNKWLSVDNPDWFVQVTRVTVSFDSLFIEQSVNISREENNYFTLAGSFYEIQYEGVKLIIKANKGARYIEYLIKNNKYSKIQSSILYKAVNPSPNLQQISENSTLSDEISIVENLDQSSEILTKKDIRILKRSLKKYDEKISQANEVNNITLSEKLQEERNQIQVYMSQNCFRGKSKKFSDPGNKTRQSISKAINSTLKTIDKDPSGKKLYEHLKATIKTGFKCFYDSELEWK